MLISVSRNFPTPVGETLIFCPYERAIKRGLKIKYWLMVGFYHVPILPVADGYEWQCSCCGRRVVPNKEGVYSKKMLLFNSIAAIGGLCMFLFFLYIASCSSAFQNVNAGRAFFGTFSLLGLIIFGKALFETRRVALNVEKIAALSDERLSQADSVLEPDDNVGVIAHKLIKSGFRDSEVQTYIQSWVTPEA